MSRVSSLFPSPAKGFLHGGGASLSFSFNPDEVQRQESASYSSSLSPGARGPFVQYVGGGDCNISFELTLDGIGGGSVAGEMAALEGLTRSSGQFKSPSRVVLGLGSRTWEGHVSQVSFSEKLFNSAFEPVFATAQVTFVIDRWEG